MLQVENLKHELEKEVMSHMDSMALMSEDTVHQNMDKETIGTNRLTSSENKSREKPVAT